MESVLYLLKAVMVLSYSIHLDTDGFKKFLSLAFSFFNIPVLGRTMIGKNVDK